MREKIVFYIYGCFTVSRYIEGGRKSHFRHIRIFRHTCMHKQPILTKQWNFNIFVQVLPSYLRHTDRLSDVLFLLLTVILSELQTKMERLSHRKSTQTCMRGITFLATRPPSFVIFYRFFRLFPPPSRVTYWLNGSYKETKQYRTLTTLKHLKST